MASITCSFCGDENVVLVSGYNYCVQCSRKLDRKTINLMLSKVFPSLTMERIKDLCTEMFGTEDYCFSKFSNLYAMLDRGEWIERDHRFKIPQSEYLVIVFHKHIKDKHPKLFERISNERSF